jgi:hypothetical protein
MYKSITKHNSNIFILSLIDTASSLLKIKGTAEFEGKLIFRKQFEQLPLPLSSVEAVEPEGIRRMRS